MLTYLLQVSLCWLIFYLLYYFWLSRETFFHLNRWYLLGTLFLGLIIPFIPSPFVAQEGDWVTLYVAPITLGLENLQVTVTAPAERAPELDWTAVLKGIYWSGVILTGMRFLSGLWRIGTLYRQSEHIRVGKFRVALTPGKHLPFSFFQVIFKSKLGDLDDFAEEKITEHELAHVRGWHTIDVLLVELVSIFLWCSPPVYLYRRSLRIVHEYIADSAAIQSGQKKQYGHLLIRQSQSGLELALANHFIQSQLKKRIMMMTKTRSSRQAVWKYLPVIPLLVVAFVVFSNWEAVAGDQLQRIPENNKPDQTEALPEQVIEALIATQEERLAPAAELNEPNELSDPVERTILNKLADNLQENSAPTVSDDYDPRVLRKQLSAILYRRQQQTENQDSKIAMSFAALQGEWAAKYPEHSKEIRQIAEEVAGQYQLALSFEDNRIAEAYFKEPFKISERKPSDMIIGSSEAGVKIRSTGDSDPYVLINNEAAPKDWKDSILPENIESINVLKGEAALNLYGDIARDGAILIYTKDFKGKKVEVRKEEPAQHPAGKVITKLEHSDKPPLYVVDGEIWRHTSLEEIDPNNIERIDVLKGESAVALYGKKGENGVVLIATKTRAYDQPPMWKACTEGDEAAKSACSQKSLLEAVYKNIRYPAQARQQGIEGMVLVEYTISKDGKVQEPEIVRGIGGGCDEEVLRVITELPDWQPAVKGGKPVAVNLILPIRYKLEGEVNVVSPRANNDNPIRKKTGRMWTALGDWNDEIVVVGYGIPKTEEIDTSPAKVQPDANKVPEKPTTVHVTGPEKTPAGFSKLELQNFKAAPNPTNGLINLRFQGESKATTVSILNPAGQVVYQREFPQFNGRFDEQIDLRQAPKGTLFIQVRQGDKIHSSTVVLQ